MTNPTPLEYDECKLFAQYLRLKGLLFSHLAQSTFTTSMGALMRNKALGVHAGVPDYMIVTPAGLLFVEMKRRKGGHVSETQAEWVAALNKIKGVQVQVCYGFDEARAFVERFIQQPLAAEAEGKPLGIKP